MTGTVPLLLWLQKHPTQPTLICSGPSGPVACRVFETSLNKMLAHLSRLEERNAGEFI